MTKRLVLGAAAAVGLVVTVVLVRVGLSSIDVDDRLATFRGALPSTLANARTLALVPSDDTIFDRLDELVAAHDLELVDATVDGDDHAPIRNRLQARVANDFAPTQTVRDVDEEGRAVAAPTPRSYTVTRSLHVVVRAEGFFVEREATFDVEKDYGIRYEQP